MPALTQSEKKDLQSQLESEMKRFISSLKSLKDDIQSSRINRFLLVGLLTNRIMTFAQATSEYNHLIQNNSAQLVFDLNLLLEACKNINEFFGKKLDKFQQQFSHKHSFFKSIDQLTTSNLNSIFQAVFHTLSGIIDVVDSIRCQVQKYIVQDDSFEEQLKNKFLKGIDEFKNFVLEGKNKYLPMPNEQEILALIQPEKSVTPIASSIPTLVAY